MTFRLSPTYRYFGLAGMVALEQGTTDTPANIEAVQGKLTVVPYFWNPSTLAFEVGRQTSTGSAGGSTTVDANLTSAGSTKEVGYFRLANPTTAVDATLSSAGSTRLVGKVEISPTTPGSSNDYLWTRAVGAGSGSTAVDATLTSDGSTRIVGKVELSPTTPGSSQDYLWMRSVSAAGAGSTEVDANLTSVGSTKLVGQFTVANPTTSVTISNPTTSVTISNPSTAVDATLTSAGSTRLVGQVTVANPTTSVSLSSQHTFTVGNPTTSVTVTSGTVLGPSTAATGLISSGTQQIGSVALVTGTTGVMGAVILAAGTSANTVGSVALVAGTSANMVGAFIQAPNSSADGAWTVDGLRFSSGQTSATTVATSAESQLLAASAARRGAVIVNLSTAVELLIGFTTAVVSTARANTHWIIPVNSRLTIGGQLGDVPLYLGPIRGRLNSTTLAGVAGILQFTT